MKNAFTSSLIAGIVMLLLACSGAPDLIPPNPNPPIPGPGGPILNLTDEQRIAVLNECGAFADALGDLQSDAQQQALVTYLKSRGEFEDAGAMGGNVWARFHDGRLAKFIPDWQDEDSEIGGRVATPDISGGRSSAEDALRMGVPEGKKVMLFHALGNNYADSGPYLLNIFSRSHTQYTVEMKSATIENLKGAKNVDVFYIDTHAGFGRVRSMDSPFSVFSLWTSDEVSVERDGQYKTALENNELTYMHAVEDRILLLPVLEWHYGISGKFVSNHMSFTENSLLYIDACNTLNPDASTFKDTMMGRATNASTTYIGWTGITDDDAGLPTSRFIFDRLLGAPVFMPEAPPQRPFDLAPIMPEVFKNNLGVARFGGKIDYESTVDGQIMLAPSIKYITMDDYNSVMTIDGIFGDNSLNDGKVTVGGLTVPYRPDDWSPDKIICDLPVTGPGSSGEVIVTVNGQESNKVPLSEWTIPLHLVRDDFGVKVDTRLDLKIRADVHRYRFLPEQVPKTERPDMIQLPPTTLGFPCSVASTGTYTVGGQRTAYCVKEKCTMRDTESAVGRHGQLPFAIVNHSLGFGAFYKWSKDMKKIEVYVVVNVPETGMEVETYTSCEGSSPVTTLNSVSTTLGILTTKPLVFNLDANFSIEAGDIPGMTSMPWGRCETPGYFKQTATWPRVEPTVRPNADTDARYAGGH